MIRATTHTVLGGPGTISNEELSRCAVAIGTNSLMPRPNNASHIQLGNEKYHELNSRSHLIALSGVAENHGHHPTR